MAVVAIEMVSITVSISNRFVASLVNKII